MPDKYFVDSNIFLYAFSSNNETKQKIAAKIITERCEISSQVINEVSVNLIKKFKLGENEVRNFVLSSYDRFSVNLLEREDFVRASLLRDQYSLSYYDSVIIASALLAECTILYSEDMQNGLMVNQRLKIVNPFI